MIRLFRRRERWVRPLPPSDPSQVYAVRIPVEHLEQLRRAAAGRGMTPAALIGAWAMERLGPAQAHAVRAPMTMTVNAPPGDPHELAKAIKREMQVFGR